MSAYRTPRAGTRPDRAFRLLLTVGGRADANTWMTLMDWPYTLATFEREIVNSLTRCHLVRIEAGQYTVTQRGREYAGPEEGGAALPGQVAGPRHVQKERPLARRNMAHAGLVREGALAYADIPSRYGSERVPHKAKVLAA